MYTQVPIYSSCTPVDYFEHSTLESTGLDFQYHRYSEEKDLEVWNNPGRLRHYSRDPISHGFALLTTHCKVTLNLMAGTQ